MDRCPVCRNRFMRADRMMDDQDTITFPRRQFYPRQLTQKAYEAIVAAVEVEGGHGLVKVHVECCFELKSQRPEVTGPVRFHVVQKPTA